MPSQKNILVLYTELAYYTIKCFSELATTYDVNIHILRMPVNKAAPFDFTGLGSTLHFYNANDFDAKKLDELYDYLKPSLIYCAGWTNEVYLNFCKRHKNKTKTLLGFDTPWNGSLRQKLGALYARLFITPNFNFAFVPGNLQIQLAKKMGFNANSIISGAYSADVDFYSRAYSDQVNRSKVLLFVGRYAVEKGVKELCEVFIELKQNGYIKDWQLWCVGVGDYKIPVSEDIKDLGFRQPTELQKLLYEPGVFILPSTFEPWGVIVHEVAAAGFPMICSDKVGSTELFLIDGKNGYLFKAGSKVDLSDKIKKMCNLNAEILKQMSTVSFELAHKITVATWAKSINNLL